MSDPFPKPEWGGPAFPVSADFGVRGGAGRLTHIGMTLRDYLAAKAMQGIVSVQLYPFDEAEIAQRAYVVADAMLKAREAKP